MRLRHVVDVQLDRAGPEPIVVEAPTRLRERIKVVARRLRRVEERRDQPRAKPSLSASAFEQRQVVDGVLRLDDRRDAEPDRQIETLQQPLVPGVIALERVRF